MKKKNKLKKRTLNQVDKFSFVHHCGEGCDLLNGAVCAECVEWAGHLSPDRERGDGFRIIG